MRMLAFICLATVAVAAAPAPAPSKSPGTEGAPAFSRYSPAAVAMAGGGGFFLAGNAFAAPDRNSCWVWKVGGDGEKIWEKSIPAADQDEIVSILPEDDGGLVVLGVSFVHEPEVGYRSWLRTFSKDGNPGEKRLIDGYGRAGVFLNAGAGAYLLACTAEREKTRYKRDYDARLLQCNLNGKVQWEKFYDKGTHESVAAGVPLGDGSFVFLATKKLPGGASDIWLFACTAQGVLTGEKLLAGGRLAASEGSFLARGKDGVAIVYSLAALPPAGEELDLAPAAPAGVHAVSFKPSLEIAKEVELTGYPSVTPPVIAATPDGGYVLAGTSAEGLRIEKLDAAWQSLWEKSMKSDAEGIITFTVRQLLASGDTAYLLGNVASPVGGNFSKNVFLAKIDLRKPGFVWFKAY